jgi:hypothetical protein
MASPDDRKDLNGMARSIDALFGGRGEPDSSGGRAEGPVPDDAEPVEVSGVSVSEDVVWEPVVPQEGPGLQPKPDVDAFAAAVQTFLESDPLARDGQARGIREMAAALREAGSLDALADAVQRLVLEGGASADEACLAMARSLVSPGVASRLAMRLGTEREEERRAALIELCRRVGHDMALARPIAMRAGRTWRPWWPWTRRPWMSSRR